MLDVAFIKLVASVLRALSHTRAADVIGQQPTAQENPTIDHEALIRHLSSALPNQTAGLISTTVDNVWSAAQLVELPTEATTTHVNLITSILSHVTLDRADAHLIQSAFSASDGTSHITDLSERLVTTTSVEIDPEQADSAVLVFLMERTWHALLATERDALRLLVDLTHAYLAQKTEPAIKTPTEAHAPPDLAANPPDDAARQTIKPPTTAQTTIGKIERADALDISVPLLETITVSLINTTRTSDIRHTDLTTAAQRARALETSLHQLTAAHDVSDDQIEKALIQLRAGRLAECGRQIANIETQLVRAENANFSAGPGDMSSVTALRVLRAQLAELGGHHSAAARHYGFAARYVPRRDARTRYTITLNEARNYELAAYHNQDLGELDHAARALTGALGMLTDKTPGPVRAATQIATAHAMLLLGHRDQVADRFDISAQMLADASANLLRSNEPDNGLDPTTLSFEAALLRAGALGWLARYHNDGALAEQTATILQETFDPNTSQPAIDDDWRGLSEFPRTQLALALTTYADVNDAERLHATAIAALESELDQIIASVQLVPAHCSPYLAFLRASSVHQALARWYGKGPTNDPARAEKHALAAAQLREQFGFAIPTSTTHVDAA